jgi:hypothetical protein
MGAGTAPPGVPLSQSERGPSVLASTQKTGSTFSLRSQPVVTTNKFVLEKRPGPGAPIRPGVYQSYPYSCLVLVPGSHPDDKCIINPSATAPRMLIIKPDLRLMPWKPVKTQ